MNNDREKAGISVGNTAREPREDTTSEISKKLRALYDSVQGEAIPDRFLDLLEKLDQIEAPSDEDPHK